jgi:hypothetical protein
LLEPGGTEAFAKLALVARAVGSLEAVGEDDEAVGLD